MKLYNLINGCTALLVVALMTACSDKGGDSPDTGNTGTPDDDQTVAVGITTEVITRANVTTEFTSGAEMNIYPKTYGRLDAPNMVENVKATMGASGWTIAPEIRIKKGQNAFLYAVAPFNAAYTDPAAIPVNVTEQVDLLYSGEYVPASFTTHNVKLNMKHALALATFNIASQGYSGAGTLTSLGISGEEVYTSGKMNVSTGKITVEGKDPLNVGVSNTVAAGGWNSDLPRLWVIPFSTKGKPATLTAVIDGKSYVIDFPEVEMRTGFQYVFHLVLTNTGLVFIPSMTETVSLNVADDAMEAMEGYGVLKFGFTGSTFTFPYFTGDNVFGTILPASGAGASYAIGGSLDLATPDTKDIVVETWNSTGFELNNLEGIESIDISGY